MTKAIFSGSAGAVIGRLSIHRLQEKMIEFKSLEKLWLCTFLRVDKLEFVPVAQDKLSARFRANANPIDIGGSLKRAIGLNGNLETLLMQGCD